MGIGSVHHRNSLGDDRVWRTRDVLAIWVLGVDCRDASSWSGDIRGAGFVDALGVLRLDDDDDGGGEGDGSWAGDENAVGDGVGDGDGVWGRGFCAAG